MSKTLKNLLCFLYVTTSMILSSSAQTCSNYTFATNTVFRSCNDLPALKSFLHYDFDSASGQLKIAYRHTGVGSGTWVAWAINPTSKGMVGSQAIVAYQQSDGTMRVYTSPISGYGTKLQEGKLSFDVTDLSATLTNTEITIFATLGLSSNISTVNQVWEDGPVSSDVPQIHSTSGSHVRSKGTLNLVSGQTGTSGGGNSQRTKGNVHGVLNAVSWGILMPIGATIARYLKVFKSADPAWFYLHISCQFSAYVVGVAGWATGLKLGSESVGIQFDAHRVIGITLFCLGTLQVFALLLRPKPDHKFRFYWNIYHHSMGYVVIILSIINVFKGFDILTPDEVWKNAYIGILISLAAIAVSMEAFTWTVVLKRRKQENSAKPSYPHGVNEAYGVNGHNYQV